VLPSYQIRHCGSGYIATQWLGERLSGGFIEASAVLDGKATQVSKAVSHRDLADRVSIGIPDQKVPAGGVEAPSLDVPGGTELKAQRKAPLQRARSDAAVVTQILDSDGVVKMIVNETTCASRDRYCCSVGRDSRVWEVDPDRMTARHRAWIMYGGGETARTYRECAKHC
jgi:hypothetical protein